LGNQIMMKSLVYGTLVFLSTLAGICFAYPEPAVIQKPGHWTVNVAFEHPQQIALRVPGRPEPMRFWYIILTVTNRTGQEVEFYPRCDLVTDSFEVLAAGQSTPPQVFELIRQRHKSKYPLLEYLPDVDNKILQGEDNAKDIAVVWPDFEQQATQIRIFVSGLSNETVAVNHPIKKARIYLRKTLELSYAVKGDPKIRSSLKLQFLGKRWVMR